jgi:hypothetical protein
MGFLRALFFLFPGFALNIYTAMKPSPPAAIRSALDPLKFPQSRPPRLPGHPNFTADASQTKSPELASIHLASVTFGFRDAVGLPN